MYKDRTDGLIGTDIVRSGRAMRDMCNPTSIGKYHKYSPFGRFNR